MTVTIVLLDEPNYDALAPLVMPWLEKLEKDSKGMECVAEIDEQFRSQHLQLFAAFDDEEPDPLIALCGTRLRTFLTGRKVCDIQWCTGRKYRSWFEKGAAAIEQFAAAEGCDSVIGYMRPGWEPALKALGYRKSHVMLEKRLHDV